MQAKIHLISYVTQIATATGCATIVHLKTLNDAIRIDLNRLRILPADIQNRRRFRVHDVRAEAVAKNLGANMFLGKWQRRPTVAGADHIRLFQFRIKHLLQRCAKIVFEFFETVTAAAAAIECIHEHGLVHVAGDPIFDIDDGTVVNIQHRLKTDFAVLDH